MCIENSGKDKITSQEELHWAQAYPEHYEHIVKHMHDTDAGSFRQWYVIKLVHCREWDESDEGEWQADLAWGPYPSRERAENVLNIQARRCAELGYKAKFIITEEI